ncbi:hypothetical protein [Flavobacterium sp. HTF]|uniref:hypothetical protein n=1 Tax=Flavobacterium sp. HTF TaxID=2170732 RepID=UPI000D5DA2C3|nr:hypothetical protein [Flavobacterium sp. HTF]PWB21834.1 hypothetical protein DCO46_18820 [Flavobacterium sp. HTF]
METKEQNIRTSENRRANLNKQNAIMNEALYNNDELKKGHQHFGDVRDYGHTVRNGYDPNKAIPNQQQLSNDEDDFDEVDDLDDDFHAPGDLDHEGDVLNDDFDNPKDIDDDFLETEKDLEDIDEDDEEEIEDDLEEDEIEEEDPGENYPDNDPRKF